MFKLKCINEFNKFKVSPLKNELISKYSDVIDKLNLYQSKESLELNMIKLNKDKRGLGKGREILKYIIDYADNNNLIMHLTPTDEFGSNIKRLKDFYKSLGFKYNRGKHREYRTKDTMIRYPK